MIIEATLEAQGKTMQELREIECEKKQLFTLLYSNIPEDKGKHSIVLVQLGNNDLYFYLKQTNLFHKYLGTK